MSETLSLGPGQRMTVVEHSADVLVVESAWEPRGSAPPAHYHPSQEERFEGLEGEVTAIVDGTEHRLGPGDTLVVPAGAVHQMFNAGDVPARARWETRPPMRTLDWFRTLDGKPSKLRMPLLLLRYRAEFRLGRSAPR